MWNRNQKDDETVEEFCVDVLRRAREVNASADMIRYAVMHGLRPELRTYVMQQNPATYDALV